MTRGGGVCVHCSLLLMVVCLACGLPVHVVAVIEVLCESKVTFHSGDVRVDNVVVGSHEVPPPSSRRVPLAHALLGKCACPPLIFSRDDM